MIALGKARTIQATEKRTAAAIWARGCRRRWEARHYAAAVLLLFLAGYVGARAFGLWENRIGDAEYVQHIQQDAVAGYGHPGL